MFQAIGSTYILKPVFETETASGLVIPGKHGEWAQYHGRVYGEILSIGPKCKDYGLKVGDRIAFVRHEGIVFFYERERYLKLKERWVLGRLEDEEEECCNFC